MTSTITDRLNGVATSVAIKVPVRVATTANITLSGLQTIDGIALASGDRVLVKDQTSAIENGVYVAASGDWVRSTDFDGTYDIVGGTQVFVNSGTVEEKNYYRVSGTGAQTPGSDAITFEIAAALKGAPGSPGEGYATIIALENAGDTASDLDDAYLAQDDIEGKVKYSSSDISAGVTAETIDSTHVPGVYFPKTSQSDGTLGGHIRKFDGPLQPRWWGAKFDDSTDDTDALQAMLNVAVADGVAIEMPKSGIAKVGSGLVLDGATGLRINGQNTRYMTSSAIELDSGSSDTTLLTLTDCSDIVMDGVTLLGKGTSSGNYVIDIEQENGDTDIEIRNSYLGQAGTAIHQKGRGLRMVNCILTTLINGIELDWPDPFTAGANGDQTAISGMRAFVFDAIRCHAWSGGFFLLNEGTNSANLKGLSINGLSCDTNMSFFKGDMNYVDAQGIDMYNSAAATYMINATSVENSRIQGRFRGQRDTTVGNTTTRDITRFAILREVDQLQMDVELQYVAEHGIVLSGNCDNFDIRLRGRELCEDNSAEGTNYYPVEIATSATIGKGKVDVAFDDSYLYSGLAIHTGNAGVTIGDDFETVTRLPSGWTDTDNLEDGEWVSLGSMVDDSAQSFDVPQRTNGRIELSIVSNTDPGFANILYRWNGTNAAVDVSSGDNARWVRATGALTGTDGTDNKANVSVHTDGKCYVENRLGATVTINYRIIK